MGFPELPRAASTDGISTGRDVSTGNTTTDVTFDGLIEAKFSVKGGYWPRSDWLFHRDGVKRVSKLKDGEGQYLWRQSVREGEPALSASRAAGRGAAQSRPGTPGGSMRPNWIPGIRVTVSIPFTGDAELWHLRPNNSRVPAPKGTVTRPIGTVPGHLDIVIELPVFDAPDEVKRELEDSLESVRYDIERQNKQVAVFNRRLVTAVRDAVDARRARLNQHDAVVRTLDFPLKRSAGAPDLDRLPIKRKLVRPRPRRAAARASEPGIADVDYEHILGVIRHEGRTFETTPQTYIDFGEEQLRDVLRAHLNGHYEGGASGETFRRSGKTDICIEAEGRAAFITECKVWHGAAEFAKGVDQLLGYLTWRDCKTALVVFNKPSTPSCSIFT